MLFWSSHYIQHQQVYNYNHAHYTIVQNKCICNLAAAEVTASPSCTSVLLDVVTSGVSFNDIGSDSLLIGSKTAASALLPRWPINLLSERNGLNHRRLATALAGGSPAHQPTITILTNSSTAFKQTLVSVNMIWSALCIAPVSYTHLTLPTNREV